MLCCAPSRVGVLFVLSCLFLLPGIRARVGRDAVCLSLHQVVATNTHRRQISRTTTSIVTIGLDPCWFVVTSPALFKAPTTTASRSSSYARPFPFARFSSVMHPQRVHTYIVHITFVCVSRWEQLLFGDVLHRAVRLLIAATLLTRDDNRRRALTTRCAHNTFPTKPIDGILPTSGRISDFVGNPRLDLALVASFSYTSSVFAGMRKSPTEARPLQFVNKINATRILEF